MWKVRGWILGVWGVWDRAWFGLKPFWSIFEKGHHLVGVGLGGFFSPTTVPKFATQCPKFKVHKFWVNSSCRVAITSHAFKKVRNVGGNRVLTFFREIRAMIQPEKWFELININHLFFLCLFNLVFNHHFKEILLVSNHGRVAKKPKVLRQGCKVLVSINRWLSWQFTHGNSPISVVKVKGPISENGPGGFLLGDGVVFCLLLPYSALKPPEKTNISHPKAAFFKMMFLKSPGGIC